MAMNLDLFNISQRAITRDMVSDSYRNHPTLPNVIEAEHAIVLTLNKEVADRPTL